MLIGLWVQWCLPEGFSSVAKCTIRKWRTLYLWHRRRSARQIPGKPRRRGMPSLFGEDCLWQTGVGGGMTFGVWRSVCLGGWFAYPNGIDLVESRARFQASPVVGAWLRFWERMAFGKLEWWVAWRSACIALCAWPVGTQTSFALLWGYEVGSVWGFVGGLCDGWCFISCSVDSAGAA